MGVAVGCAFSENNSAWHANRRATGPLRPGFVDPSAPPAPESTIKPKRGSWCAVHPPRGYRVVLLTSGDDIATRTLVTAVEQWSAAEAVSLETVAVTKARAVDGIVQ